MPKSSVVVADDTLFDRYEHPGTGRLLGISKSGSKALVIEGERGALSVSACSAQASVTVLAKRLKQGYQLVSGRAFYNARAQSFTSVHPDTEWRGAEIVLISHQPSTTQAVDAITQLVARVPDTCIDHVEIGAWREQQLRNTSHVIAFNDHPVWALALAEMVYQHGWDWRVGPKLTSPPNQPPSQQPAQWCQWLQQSFKLHAISAAQAGLGWTLAGLVTSDIRDPDTGGLSAIL